MVRLLSIGLVQVLISICVVLNIMQVSSRFRMEWLEIIISMKVLISQGRFILGLMLESGVIIVLVSVFSFVFRLKVMKCMWLEWMFRLLVSFLFMIIVWVCMLKFVLLSSVVSSRQMFSVSGISNRWQVEQLMLRMFQVLVSGVLMNCIL